MMTNADRIRAMRDETLARTFAYASAYVSGSYKDYDIQKWLRWLKTNNDRCPICGGRLSEVRKQGGRKWQHCFSCHLEQEVKDD